MRRLAQFVRLRASASVSRLASRVWLSLCVCVRLASVSRLAQFVRLRASRVCVRLASVCVSRLASACVCVCLRLASGVCVRLVSRLSASRVCLTSRVPNARVCLRRSSCFASVCPCECLRGTGSFYASVVIQRV